MSGFPSLVSLLAIAVVVVPLAIVLRRWYARDSQRSLLVLCILLALASPWLALVALLVVKWPGIVVHCGTRIRGN